MKVRRWHVGVTAGAVSVAALLSGSMGSGSPTPSVGARVDNFMLEDPGGVGRELYYYRHNPAVVIVSTAAGDKASAAAVKAVDAMRAPYEKQGVMFFGLDSGAKEDAAIGALVKATDLPVLRDDLKLVGRS